MLKPFKFPAPLLINQKLTKKSFYEMGSLSNPQQKLLQEHVDTVQLSAHLTADKTNIPIYKSDKNEYIEILVIEVQLKNQHTPQGGIKASSDSSNKQSSKHIKLLHELFHKAIPYPVVLIIHSGQQSQLSLAEKFINQADVENEKLIMNELIQTDWLDPNQLQPEEQLFVESIQYNQLHKQNLYILYQSLIQRFTALLLAKKTGLFNFPLQSEQPSQDDIDQQRAILKTIMQLDRDITELKNKIANCNQFNEKVELNMQLQKLNNQLKQVKEA